MKCRPGTRLLSMLCELSSQSLESRRVPGLYFIGEVVDVTGWLGGYNFQWAWASAVAAAKAITASPD